MPIGSEVNVQDLMYEDFQQLQRTQESQCGYGNEVPNNNLIDEIATNQAHLLYYGHQQNELAYVPKEFPDCSTQTYIDNSTINTIEKNSQFYYQPDYTNAQPTVNNNTIAVRRLRGFAPSMPLSVNTSLVLPLNPESQATCWSNDSSATSQTFGFKENPIGEGYEYPNPNMNIYKRYHRPYSAQECCATEDFSPISTCFSDSSSTILDGNFNISLETPSSQQYCFPGTPGTPVSPLPESEATRIMKLQFSEQPNRCMDRYSRSISESHYVQPICNSHIEYPEKSMKEKNFIMPRDVISESNLPKIMAKHQSVAASTLLKCPYPNCNKTFTRNYNLQSHISSHAVVKPFKCPVCKKSFSRKHDMKRHERLHNGKREYQCKGVLSDGSIWGCGKTFARLDALNRHFRSDIGTKCISRALEERSLLLEPEFLQNDSARHSS